MREPRFIYFDLGNVLLFFDHHRAARQMAELAGVSEAQAWQVVFENDLDLRYEAGQISSRQFYEEFCQSTKSQPDYESMLHAFAAIFDLNARIVPIVAHLHAAGYRLGILSNTSEAHWNYVGRGRYAVVHYFFSVRALSYEIGVMKPDPKIYQEAVRLAGVPPEEIFFMDDRPDNVTAACNAGFDAVLFRDANQLAADLRARGVRWNY